MVKPKIKPKAKLTMTVEFSESLTKEEKDEITAALHAQCEEDENGFSYSMYNINISWDD